MSDRIEVLNIRASGCHGVTDLERAKVQTLLIDLELELDLSKAGASDALDDTVDFSFLHKKVVAIVDKTSFKLLEALSQRIVTEIFEDKRILSARLKVAKPERLDGATPAIIIQRSNK